MSNHQELLALLLPPLSYAPSGPSLRAELTAEGQALDTSLVSAGRAKSGITPFFAEQLLPDWERVCGITPQAGAAYQQRLQAVLAKLSETGGLSIPYFIRLAARMGYQITIDEPQQFHSGVSRAGSPLNLFDVIWTWWVNIQGPPLQHVRFRAGLSTIGERLGLFGDPVIETMFNDLKPAHTLVFFRYTE